LSYEDTCLPESVKMRVENTSQSQLKSNKLQNTTIAILCFIWYFTSGQNTVSIKKYSAIFREHYSQNDGEIDVETTIKIMLVLTCLQLGTCTIFSTCLLVLKLYIYPTPDSSDEEEPIWDHFRPEWTIAKCAVPALHFIGSVSTNIGFMYGSASLVQIIKLLEPTQTLILWVLLAGYFHKEHGVTKMKVLSIALITLGAVIAMFEKSMHVNVNALFFSFCSGTALSLRNVLKKVSSTKKLDGILNIAVLSMNACWISFIVSTTVARGDWIVIAKMSFSINLLLYYASYNTASLLVLSFVSAPTHSLLNVGKRFYNICLTMVIFDRNIPLRVLWGVMISTVGSTFYVGSYKFGISLILLSFMLNIAVIFFNFTAINLRGSEIIKK